MTVVILLELPLSVNWEVCMITMSEHGIFNTKKKLNQIAPTALDKKSTTMVAFNSKIGQ